MLKVKAAFRFISDASSGFVLSGLFLDSLLTNLAELDYTRRARVAPWDLLEYVRLNPDLIESNSTLTQPTTPRRFDGRKPVR